MLYLNIHQHQQVLWQAHDYLVSPIEPMAEEGRVSL